MKKIISLLLILLLLLSGCNAEKSVPTDYDFSGIIKATAEKTIADTPNPVSDTNYGEWSVINIARLGMEENDGWYETYYENLCTALKESDGKLTATKHTTYSRVLLAISVLGKDASDVAGYSIFDHFMLTEDITKQGLSAVNYALIAMDCLDYDFPNGSEVSREVLIDYILEKEFADGGWAIMGDTADVDITAQTLQALAKYRDRADVSDAIDRAVYVLSELQTEEGGFMSWDSFNSQSTSQVIIALTTLGINVRTDERFIKGENWVGSYLMKYYLGDGSFCHTLGKEKNPMATDQALQALICIDRFDEGKTAFYDFTDIR